MTTKMHPICPSCTCTSTDPLAGHAGLNAVPYQPSYDMRKEWTHGRCSSRANGCRKQAAVILLGRKINGRRYYCENCGRRNGWDGTFDNYKESS